MKSCPIPFFSYPKVLLAHGGGGRLMRDLIEKIFCESFGSRASDLHDSAVLQWTAQSYAASRLAFTTDSYVVRPLFFPGGDIGMLAVNGTVNDLAMSGARPAFLSVGFILEEGLDMEVLWQIAQSMRKAADAARVRIVTGDTKVVERGKGDGVFINTAGIGVIEHGLDIAPSRIRAGDAILLNGDVGRHGIAIMAAREDLRFESGIESDCAPVSAQVSGLIDAGIEIHCLRDLTRGGLASAAVELAEARGVQLHIDESSVPVRTDVHGACELLGFDPLYVANEGRFISFVPAAQAQQALALLRAYPGGGESCVIGSVRENRQAGVTLKSKIGTHRILDMLSGEQLPRIC
jgi:hydrogenase expression/formation protein HypE